MDVLEELIWDNRVEVNFTLATECGMVLQSDSHRTHTVTASSRLPV